jgi:hypothetical protein
VAPVCIVRHDARSSGCLAHRKTSITTIEVFFRMNYWHWQCYLSRQQDGPLCCIVQVHFPHSSQ